MRTRTQKINLLAKAITAYYAEMPRDPRSRRKHLEAIAIRFSIHRNTMIQAIQLASGTIINNNPYFEKGNAHD